MEAVTFYLTSGLGLFVGVTEIDPLSPLPMRTVTKPPPIADGEIAIWTGSAWNVTEVEPIAAPSGPTIPAEVSAAQAKTALYQAGLYDQVETALGASPYALIRIWWTSAQVWRFDHPYIQGMAAELGLTDDQVEALFAAAAAVPT